MLVEKGGPERSYRKHIQQHLAIVFGIKHGQTVFREEHPKLFDARGLILLSLMDNS
ncbi:uncharacterized protein G2W53_036260 [Senna tora]|uniref:Uncharacterized protein n=1 Tax=Senna tora TaxID=362788 RepID=A0A834STK7_9FABA|nr:uncharacterized protein G2W53_036260 [Senna tora]